MTTKSICILVFLTVCAVGTANGACTRERTLACFNAYIRRLTSLSSFTNAKVCPIVKTYFSCNKRACPGISYTQANRDKMAATLRQYGLQCDLAKIMGGSSNSGGSSNGNRGNGNSGGSGNGNSGSNSNRTSGSGDSDGNNRGNGTRDSSDRERDRFGGSSDYGDYGDGSGGRGNTRSGPTEQSWRNLLDSAWNGATSQTWSCVVLTMTVLLSFFLSR